MSVEFLGMTQLESGLVGKPVATFAAPVSAVQYDRGCDSQYYFGRRQYIRLGKFARGEADGRIHCPGDTLKFKDAEVLLY